MFKKSKISQHWGPRLVGGWLIFSGLIPILQIHFNHMDTAMSLLAIAAGIAILLDL